MDANPESGDTDAKYGGDGNGDHPDEADDTPRNIVDDAYRGVQRDDDADDDTGRRGGGADDARPAVTRDGGSTAVDERDSGRGSADDSSRVANSSGSAATAEKTNGHGTAPDRVAPERQHASPVDTRDEQSLRGFLDAGESLSLVRDGTLLGDYRGPATVGLTDHRLLVVTEAGEFVSVGLDRVSSVRSNSRTTVDVTGNDARLMFGIGYVLAIVGFLGVLAGSVSAFTPVLTLVTLGGLVAVDHVRRTGGDVDASPLETLVETVDGADDVVDRLETYRGRLSEHVSEEDQALWASGALAVVPFLGILLVEGGILVPLFALLTVASIGLVVYTFRNEESFDGFELDWQRQRTVTACLDNGRTVTVRTDVDSDLDRQLAGDVVATAPRRGEVYETTS